MSEREREGERGRQRGLGLNCWSLTDRIDVACHMLVQFINGFCQNHWHPCPQGFKRKRSLKKRGVCVRRKRGSNRERETERERDRERQTHTSHTSHKHRHTITHFGREKSSGGGKVSSMAVLFPYLEMVYFPNRVRCVSRELLRIVDKANR